MDIVKPVFIVGVGRSGSTIFHKIFARHPNLAWLSGYLDRYPTKPQINKFLMNVIDWPIIPIVMKRNYPEECYSFWEYYCKGFRTPCRDLTSNDVTIKAKTEIRKVLAGLLTPRRNRLLLKITGWPRIGYLNEIFDNAKFIHIIRDGRAAVNSMINEPWWWGWRGPENWRWGRLTVEQEDEWEKHNKSFLALAAIEWKIILNALEKSRKYIKPNQLMEIKYENLCENTVDVFKKVVDFSDLKWSDSFENVVQSYQLKVKNYKWQEQLTKKQQEILEKVLSPYLSRYGYK